MFFEDSKEFLLRFRSLEDLKKFSSTYPFYFDKCKGEFKCDDCFYSIILTSEFDLVRRHLFNFDLYRDVDFCYPIAIKSEPLVL